MVKNICIVDILLNTTKLENTITSKSIFIGYFSFFNLLASFFSHFFTEISFLMHIDVFVCVFLIHFTRFHMHSRDKFKKEQKQHHQWLCK